MNFRAVKLYLKFSYLVFFDKIQPSFTALKFSNNENFRVLKFSTYDDFRVLKFFNLAVLSDLNFRVRFSSKSGEFWSPKTGCMLFLGLETGSKTSILKV